MKTFYFTLLGCALAAACLPADAQTTTRIRGTIATVDANALSVKSRDGKELKLRMTEKTTVAYPKAIKLSDIKPGDFVGSTAVPNNEGQLVAREVHLFPESGRGTGEGHYPWDTEKGSTMTNANVANAVKAANGQELTLEYKGGSRKVIVPPNVPVVTTVPGDRSLLVPGHYVFVIAQPAPDGTMTALRIQAEKDGVKPPQ
jgi:hypothetical protein